MRSRWQQSRGVGTKEGRVGVDWVGGCGRAVRHSWTVLY